MGGSFVDTLYNDEPVGTFVEGHIFTSAPDLTGRQGDPANGYWHCDTVNHDKLTWSAKVYELFGLPAGSPINREWAVTRYADQSKNALERVRKYALSRGFGFILDASIESEDRNGRWIRVLAVPIFEDGRVIGLHGLKRAM